MWEKAFDIQYIFSLKYSDIHWEMFTSHTYDLQREEVKQRKCKLTSANTALRKISFKIQHL